MLDGIFKTLDQFEKPPLTGDSDFKKWIEQQDFIHFLLATRKGDVPLYVSYKNTYIYSLFLPIGALKGNYIEELLEWDVSPNSSWGYGYSFGKKKQPKSITLDSPFGSAKPSLLKTATPITYSRYFEGRKDGKSYIEINQFITHLHNIHWEENHNAFCKIEEDGNIDKVLNIYPSKEGSLVTFNGDLVNFHQFLTKTVLIRFFDRMVFRDQDKFNGWSNPECAVYRNEVNEIFCRMGVDHKNREDVSASYIRGFQIVRNVSSRKEMITRLQGEHFGSKKYETYITMDWRNKKVAEVSCDPDKLGNYFVESEKPFEISPVFFKPEVLSKYKADPDKYTVSQRGIECRGAWSLRSYDINNAGQVHVYLIDLSRLPYLEQLYWKSFNEPPKTGISERAFNTDFKGTWDTQYDPLHSLKEALNMLQKARKLLWNCSDDDILRRLNYPVTNAEKEWVDEIHTLDKLVNEGFSYIYLKAISIRLDCFNEKYRSLRLLQTVLEKRDISEEERGIIIEPLLEITRLRTKFAGHRSGEEAIKIKKDLIKKYGSLKQHFRSLVERTDKAVRSLVTLKAEVWENK